jgi:iron only hydrogenase large subunit-like protein/nitrogen-specific signal transduction histidine kinase
METLQLVTTIKDRCKTCYQCVRYCPAKAIKISDGQAEVIPDRCIGCGNCVRVCSQQAKEVLSSSGFVEKILESESKCAALIAPSFPAQFYDIDYKIFIGMLKKLGFDYVIEVAFGADLVAKECKKLYESKEMDSFIESSCPAIVSFIEKYHPKLIKNLSSIVSPMVATAKVVDKMYGEGIKKVFIGPCIAKKGEAQNENLQGNINVVITFAELEQMFIQNKIYSDNIESCDFNEPKAHTGRVFPLSHGFFQAADIKEDLTKNNAITADGQEDFIEAIKEFEKGEIKVGVLEMLSCKGCIMGVGINNKTPQYFRHARVSKFVNQSSKLFDKKVWEKNIEICEDIDLKRKYTHENKLLKTPSNNEIEMILKGMGKTDPEDELNCGACGYETCVEHATAIYKGLAEYTMCLPYTIEKLKNTVDKLEISNIELNNTQEALMHSERLASMGQLAAGIAHEINNPLGVILLYSHILLEKTEKDSKLFKNLNMITDQAVRTKKIVSGLLNFARQNKVAKQPCNVEELINKIVKSFVEPEISIEIIIKTVDLEIEIDKDQINQVISNLISNAKDAMPGGGKISIIIESKRDDLLIIIKDTGNGIPKENLSKIFNPFYTTKKIGKGTGLGLAVTYGIIKMHSGQISAQSNTDPEKGEVGTEIIVSLPKVEKQLERKIEVKYGK